MAKPERPIAAVDIAYHIGGRDPQLLSIAEAQGEVLLDDSGFSVAVAVRDGKAKPFEKKSINLSDGANGDEGGVAVLRSGSLELVFKYAAQGLSHGHYDKLSFSYITVSIEELSGRTSLFIVATDASKSKRHRIEISGKVYGWSGPYLYAEVE